MGETLRIPTLDGAGSFPAYVARPSSAPVGAIIVIQEIFGVNPGIRDKADRWASLGYLAVAPEVFWRQGEGIDLDSDVPEQFQQAIAYMMAHDFETGIRDVEAAICWIRDIEGVSSVGLVGYSMGGKIAY